MATRIITDGQSTKEIRTHFVDFSPDLPTGINVVSAAATHTPPSGTASTPTVINTLAPIIQVTLGPLTVTGKHEVSVLATLSDGEKSEINLVIVVAY
jgi:hypothetical protein